MSSGILVTSKSLVLQSVSRGGAGLYTCAATNTQASSTSNPVKLVIMYAPECMVDQPAVLAVGKGERVNISCRVASNPLRATFHWKLNGSERTYSKFSGISSVRGQLVSHYSFLGTSDKDYGSLLCWANNSVGVQQKACVFTIIPAGTKKGPPTHQTAQAGGPPSPPEGCEILNNTAENIEVACLQGFDGGVGQQFLAEIYDESGSLHLNRTSEEPQFSIETLEPGKTYVIRISAFNAKGRSQTVSLTASTLKVAEKRMGETKPFIYSPLIPIFLGILGVFVVLILLLVFITQWRRNVTSGSSAPLNRMPSPPPATKPISAAKTVETVEEPVRDGALKKPASDDEVPHKPKKRVMVLENGRVERTGVEDSAVTDVSIKEIVPTRSTSFSGPILPNGSTGYYDRLKKSSYSPGFSTDIMSLSPSSSGASSPAFPISAPSIQAPHRSYPRIALPPVNALSPLPEEYSGRSSHSSSHHVSTLPRSRDQYDSLMQSKDVDDRRTLSRSPYRSGLASVGERYHLMQEVKANPKYVVRRGVSDLDDESFV
ncbi:Immunoglobulin-like domain [Trinorchestia longiramus]|nr:Immunoglobulin-like domain [Trinorchestia longiramus]